MTDDDRTARTRKLVFDRCRLWLVLFVIAVAVHALSELVANHQVVLTRELIGPAIFASAWTGLSILQARYNAGRTR